MDITTLWMTPSIVSQYAEPEAELVDVRWDDTDNFSSMNYVDGRYVKTVGDLVHISRSPKTDIITKSYYLKIQGYNFSNLSSIMSTITGVEARITAKRAGRIMDETVALCIEDTIKGENQAGLLLDPVTYYGSSDFLWKTKGITVDQVMDPTFGIIVSFQGHKEWPCRDFILLDCVEVRISGTN
jgi:hypothetical protein